MKLTMKDRPELDALLKQAVEAYAALSPEAKADHDYEQRRSFARGMCPSKRDYTDWCEAVDRLLPPLKH